jgi:protein ImuB
MTDWFSLQAPERRAQPFVLTAPVHGRVMIVAANIVAETRGIHVGMALADARAVEPTLLALPEKPDLAGRLLHRLAEWCIRFTPIVAVNLPDGLLLDVSGCAHLWGGETPYLETILKKLQARHYDVQAAMADTPGLAWAVARYGRAPWVIDTQGHVDALLTLPPEALRLEADAVARMHKLGLHQIRQFIHLPRTSLRRRFGESFLQRLGQALGHENEVLESVQPVEAYQERLPCLEPIVTATGIAIALEQLLQALCQRLQQEQKGLRTAVLKGYRVDGRVEQVTIGTHRPSNSPKHLGKLFEPSLPTIEPALGIELFILEAPKVEDHYDYQEKLWEGHGGLDDLRLSELIDRLAGRLGTEVIHRYVPDEHYWPERSLRRAISLQELSASPWCLGHVRPLQLLAVPERIEVTAPIPDYPPMLFIYKGQRHKIVRADGPERIEQEWWLQQGQHRDYYRVEDEEGRRYWLFRLGHYHEKIYQWFIHGFLA